MKISPWWDRKRGRMDRFITSNTDPLEAVKYAQTSGATAFDHRRGYKDKVVQFKLKELIKKFHELPDIKESKVSIPGTVGENGYSNIFLTHLYFYLNIMKYHKAVPKKVLEIGAGYGGLARIFKALHPKIEYTIIDLAESTYFSKHFLALNDIDARFVPIENFKTLLGESFDIAINTFSFQEMPFSTVLEYVDFIQSSLEVDGFYTCNYYMNDVVTKEQSYDGELPVDDKWSPIYSNYNASILTIDSPKNFRELYLKRLHEHTNLHDDERQARLPWAYP